MDLAPNHSRPKPGECMQGLHRGLQGVAAGKENIEVVSNRMRLVDAYIKAYYIPWGEELHRWAVTHPEYTQVGGNPSVCACVG